MTVPKLFVEILWFMLDTCFPGVWDLGKCQAKGTYTTSLPMKTLCAKSPMDFLGQEHHKHVVGFSLLMQEGALCDLLWGYLKKPTG